MQKGNKNEKQEIDSRIFNHYHGFKLYLLFCKDSRRRSGSGHDFYPHVVSGSSGIHCKRYFFRGEKVLGWNTCHAKYALAAVGIPAVYLFVSYGVYWIINSMSFTGQIYKTN